MSSAPVLAFALAGRACGLARQAGELALELAAAFEPAWLARNQKFDVSFRAREPRTLRLSYNGFGEPREAFLERVVRCARRLAGPAAAEAWTAAARAARGAAFQPNFGLSWPAEGRPTVKLYLEELDAASEDGRRALARRVAAALGGAASGWAPCAISVEVGPEGLRLKEYARVPPPAPARDLLPALGCGPSFWLLAARRAAGGPRDGLKAYRIYERRTEHGAAALRAVERLWAAFDGGAALGETLGRWRAAGLRPYGVAAAVPVGARPGALDVYVSAGPA